MTVKAILDIKGRDVVTITAEKTVNDAAALLARHGIGAVVVTSGNERIAGIISERDIVRVIAADGASTLEKPVSAVMTARVQICQESNTINEVMQIMTEGRFRHLPVMQDGRMIGIISIGDVVKHRLHELETEAHMLHDYISGGA